MREMKDSGIEWLRQVPNHWNIHPLYFYFGERKNKNTHAAETNLLSLSYGKIKQKDINTNEGLLPENFNGYNIIEKNDIVLRLTDLQNDKRSLRTGLSRERGIITSAYVTLKPVRKLDSGYFHYLLHAFDLMKVLYNMGNGVRQSLNYSELSKMPLVEPPLSEQTTISAYLDQKCAEFDALTSDIQTQIENLEQYKRSVISEAVTRGLNRNAALKDSGIDWIRSIPCHWSIIPAKYLFYNSNLRKQPEDEQLTASQKHGIISQQDYMVRENAKIVLATQGIESWKHVEPNDYIISLRSFQGGLEMSEIAGCITWHYVVIKAIKKIHPRYYKWLFKSSQYVNALQGTCNFIRDGQDLRFSNFTQVPLFEPPYEEQRSIATYIDQKCSEIDSILSDKKAQREVINQYKKSLIFEYVTGKKEVLANES